MAKGKICCDNCKHWKRRKRVNGTAPCKWLGKPTGPEAFCGSFDARVRLAKVESQREADMMKDTKTLFRQRRSHGVCNG